MNPSESKPKPELVIGLVGPIGVDMKMIQAQIETALLAVGYTPVGIRATDLMRQVAVDVTLENSTDPHLHYDTRIRYANAVREKCENDAALAALAIAEIGHIREQKNLIFGKSRSGDVPLSQIPLPAHAFVLRQLKRKEEILLLRQVYGRKFLQVSVSLDATDRTRLLANRIASRNPSLSKKQAEEIAENLVDRDMNEQAVVHGQKIEDIFHLGDVFVSTKTESVASETIKRFIDAFFGRNSISPNRDEYGAYIAASASLRSLDVSRQVGAAIFTPAGAIIALGTNEVPAAGGGTYWADHPDPHRDYEEGHDPNNTQKQRILFDILKRLKAGGFISLSGDDNTLFEKVIRAC